MYTTHYPSIIQSCHTTHEQVKLLVSSVTTCISPMYQFSTPKLGIIKTFVTPITPPMNTGDTLVSPVTSQMD